MIVILNSELVVVHQAHVTLSKYN